MVTKERMMPTINRKQCVEGKYAEACPYRIVPVGYCGIERVPLPEEDYPVDREAGEWVGVEDLVIVWEVHDREGKVIEVLPEVSTVVE
jgi:hypothetical protein